MKVIRAGIPNYNLVHFEWVLTNWCNYSCNYCSSAHFMTDSWQRENSVSSYKLTLAKLRRYDGEFNIELYGGEPTLHPDIVEILDELVAIENCKKIEIITNLARPLPFWSKIVRDGVNICASYHPDYAEDFVDKVVAVSRMGGYIRATVNLSPLPEHWERTRDVVIGLRDAGIEYNLHHLTDTSTWKAEYTSEFYEYFKPYESTVYHSVVTLNPYEFSDGSVCDLTDLEVFEGGYHKLRGYSCRPLYYRIGFDGVISNICTGRVVRPLMIKSADLNCTEICPLDSCPCEDMFKFYKECTDE